MVVSGACAFNDGRESSLHLQYCSRFRGGGSSDQGLAAAATQRVGSVSEKLDSADRPGSR